MDPARMDPGTQPLLGSGVHCSYTTTDTDVCVCVCVSAASPGTHTLPHRPACIHAGQMPRSRLINRDKPQVSLAVRDSLLPATPRGRASRRTHLASCPMYARFSR